jgi:hypothetical protein
MEELAEYFINRIFSPFDLRLNDEEIRHQSLIASKYRQKMDFCLLGATVVSENIIFDQIQEFKSAVWKELTEEKGESEDEQPDTARRINGESLKEKERAETENEMN